MDNGTEWRWCAKCNKNTPHRVVLGGGCKAFICLNHREVECPTPGESSVLSWSSLLPLQPDD